MFVQLNLLLLGTCLGTLVGYFGWVPVAKVPNTMPKLAQQISDLAARKARPKAAAYMLASGNGVHLVVQPTGLKQWLVRYRMPDGKRGKKIVGIYPDMSIADAHKVAEDLHLS
jgi:hypothetical protein